MFKANTEYVEMEKARLGRWHPFIRRGFFAQTAVEMEKARLGRWHTTLQINYYFLRRVEMEKARLGRWHTPPVVLRVDMLKL